MHLPRIFVQVLQILFFAFRKTVAVRAVCSNISRGNGHCMVMETWTQVCFSCPTAYPVSWTDVKVLC